VETPLSTITRLQENKRKGRTTPKQKTTHLTNPKHNTKKGNSKIQNSRKPNQHQEITSTHESSTPSQSNKNQPAKTTTAED
jgi:hypothetical protein